MQNTLVHIHKDISLPFYIYLYLYTALSLLKWYPVVDFFFFFLLVFFQFFFISLHFQLYWLQRGWIKKLPSPNAYTIFTVCTTFAFLKSCEVSGSRGGEIKGGIKGGQSSMGRWSFSKAPFKDFFHSSYTEMKTNALFSNKSFPAISSASKRQYQH